MLVYGTYPKCSICGGIGAVILLGKHTSLDTCLDDTFRMCEQAYNRCTEHWKTCSKKACPDGEWASKEQMCKQGRVLTEQWEQAESNHQRITMMANSALKGE